MTEKVASSDAEQTLFAMLDRIGKESRKAYKITNLLFIICLGLGICSFFGQKFLLPFISNTQQIWLIVICAILSFWFRKVSELYKDTASKLNDSIGGSDGLLPLDSNIILKTEISINMQIRELYECRGNIYKCPFNLDIPTNLELYQAMIKAHPDDPLSRMVLTIESRNKLRLSDESSI